MFQNFIVIHYAFVVVIVGAFHQHDTNLTIYLDVTSFQLKPLQINHCIINTLRWHSRSTVQFSVQPMLRLCASIKDFSHKTQSPEKTITVQCCIGCHFWMIRKRLAFCCTGNKQGGLCEVPFFRHKGCKMKESNFRKSLQQDPE